MTTLDLFHGIFLPSTHSRKSVLMSVNNKTVAFKIGKIYQVLSKNGLGPSCIEKSDQNKNWLDYGEQFMLLRFKKRQEILEIMLLTSKGCILHETVDCPTGYIKQVKS
jgi:hypothetical protein